jgi:hypothetical protein
LGRGRPRAEAEAGERVVPGSGDTSALAVSYIGSGHLGDATAVLRRIVARDPSDADAASLLAWLFATAPDADLRDGAAAAKWLGEYALYPRDRAEQRVRFIDQYRSYVINYNLGKDLVHRYVEVFEKLLSSPMLPSLLM